MKNTKFFFIVCCTLLVVGCGKDPGINSKDGTFKDSRDQHVYKYVKIGTQTWMAENLAYLPAVSPSSDGSETSAFYYVYDYEKSSVGEAKTNPDYTTYGVLYNWVAAKAACPSGWYLPTDPEWKILETYLGMSQPNADSEGWRDSGLIGKALKFTSGWNENGQGDNSSGFSAFPGGSRDGDGGFSLLGVYAVFWTASDSGTLGACGRLLGYVDGVARGYDSRNNGFSVRCLRD